MPGDVFRFHEGCSLRVNQCSDLGPLRVANWVRAGPLVEQGGGEGDGSDD